VSSRDDPAPLSIASEGLSHDRRTLYPAAMGRSPRPSSPQSLLPNETWKDNFTPEHSVNIQG
jgi:hypothetical protein